MNKTVLIAFYTIAYKEARRLIRIWPQTILPPIITTSLYFLIFGKIIGSRIGHMEGVDFIHFITPGLVMMTLITNSYFNTVSSFFGAKFQRSIEEIVVAPVPSWTILIGFISGGIIRGMLISMIVTLTAMSFATIHIKHPFLFVMIALLSSAFFATAGIINSYYAKKFDDVTIVPTFILTPLAYLGGIFYPINMLPGIWHYISLLNPIAYIIDAARFCFLGASAFSGYIALIMLLFFTLLLFVIALFMLEKGTHYTS